MTTIGHSTCGVGANTWNAPIIADILLYPYQAVQQ
jgi:hypothetical protein